MLSSQPLPTQRAALIGLFTVSVFWGISYVLSAYLLQGFSPVLLTFLRIAAAFLLLLGLSRLQPLQRPGRIEWLLLLGSSFFFTLVQQPLYFLGLQSSSAVNGSLIYAVAPLVIMLLEAAVFRIKLVPRKVAGALLGLAGVLIIVLFGPAKIEASIGDLYLIGAMLGFSISLLFIPRLSRSLSTLTINVYSSLIGLPLILPFVLVEGIAGKPEVSTAIWMWLLLGAAAAMNVLSGWWWTRGVASVGAGTASLFNNLPPFVALFGGYLLLGEVVNVGQIIGGMIILFGVFISTFAASRKPVIGAGSSG